jgi:LysM repeat protein
MIVNYISQAKGVDMVKRNFAIFAILLIIIFSSACTRSATKTDVTPTSVEPTFMVNTEPANPLEESMRATEKALVLTPADPAQELPIEGTLSFETTVPGSVLNPEGTAIPIINPVPVLTRPTSYTLQKDEFPFCIARRFNVDIAELLSLNGLTADSQVPPGTTLQVPQSGEWTAGERALRSHPTTYTVQANDTVNSIACYFGDVDPNAILAANNLASSSITTGQTLTIP